MNTESPEKRLESQAEAPDFKEIYQNGVSDDAISAVAKVCAGKILERLTTLKQNSSAAAITDRMQAAIAINDHNEIIRLADELKSLKHEEESHLEKLVSISEEFSFDELLSAYPSELEALAYELATISMSAIQEEMSKSKKRERSGERRSRSAAKTYVLSRGDKSMEIVPNVGAPANPGKERDLFTFLGFTVSADGRSLTPAVFTSKDGAETPATSKKAIIEDILAGGSYWLQKGFTIAEKPAKANQGEDKAA